MTALFQFPAIKALASFLNSGFVFISYKFFKYDLNSSIDVSENIVVLLILYLDCIVGNSEKLADNPFDTYYRIWCTSPWWDARML